MPPHSNLVDFALDVIDTEDCNGSTSDDRSFIKWSQHSLASATSSKQQKKAKSVCFDQYDDMVEIEHVDDFSQEQVDDLWWSPQEQHDIRMTCCNLVERSNAGDVMNKEEMLGLEKHTHAVAKPVKKLRRAVYEAVFSIQEMEQASSSSAGAQPSLIAELYEESGCAKSSLKAHLSALKLAWEVDTESDLS